MNIIFQTPNKFNIDFGVGDFESVNQETYANISKNVSDIDDLDVIPKNIRCIKKLIAHVDRMEDFVTNNVENIINILTKHELIELDPSTLLSSISLFHHENA